MQNNRHIELNELHYNRMWNSIDVANPSIWPHWSLISKFKKQKMCLELGPGAKPKIKIKDNYFLDISQEAVHKLNTLGAKATVSNLKHKFPFQSEFFDLICAFEVLEHVENDLMVLKEIKRCLKPQGVCLISFPLHMGIFNAYDQVVGHIRRYNPRDLETLFKRAGLKIIKFSSLDVPWPNKPLGVLFKIFVSRFPHFFSKMQMWLESNLLFKSIQNIELLPWESSSYKNLEQSNTALLELNKIR